MHTDGFYSTFVAVSHNASLRKFGTYPPKICNKYRPRYKEKLSFEKCNNGKNRNASSTITIVKPIRESD